MKQATKLFSGFFVLFCIFSLAIATDFQQLANLANQRYGSEAKQKVLQLESLLNQLQSEPDSIKLKRINAFFNAHITFVSDKNHWGEKDYWATPLESLGTTKGDCEDYSIAKYIFLRELGIPDERLKLTYVRAKIGGPQSKVSQAHMVLSYYATPSAEPLILDNLMSDIHESSRRVDLRPIFSFNSQGLWTGIKTNKKGASLKSLSRWRNVLTRIKNDGIE
jgi:predicted transglutaminase-like cysteine proteinase